MYSLEFERSANKFFQKLPREDQIIIARKLKEILPEPHRYLKKLSGTKLWRLRVKDYRVVLDVIIAGRKIIVLRIGHRKNVYKN